MTNISKMFCSKLVVQILWATLFYLTLPSVTQAEEVLPKIHLLLFSPENPANRRAADNIEYMMNDLPVVFNVVVHQDLNNSSDKHETAIRALRESNVSLVFFFELEKEQQVFYYVKTDDEPKKMVRTLAGSGKLSLEDTVAIITYSTVEFLLETQQFSTPASTTVPQKPKSTNLDNERSQPNIPKFYTGLGYVFVLGSSTPNVSHGGRLHIAFRVFDVLRINLGLGMGTPFESSESQIKVSAFYLPIRLGLSVMFTKKKLHFGGGSALILNAIKVSSYTNRDDANMEPPNWISLPGIEFSFSLEILLKKNLGFFISAAAQVLTQTVEFEVKDGPRLFDEYWRIRPEISVGLQLMLF